MEAAAVLPVLLAVLMGLAVLAYVVLDGFDLGIGILLPFAEPAEKDRMIEAIGPFWDANETWLIFALALLIAAFPIAYATMIPALYPPILATIVGLLIRAAAFAIRGSAPLGERRSAQFLFVTGSLIAALGQGYVLGKYVLMLRRGLADDIFAALIACCLTAGYAALGAAWLMHKCRGRLQAKASLWLRRTLWPGAVGMGFVSIALPLASDLAYEKWLAWPEIGMLAPVPLVWMALFAWLYFLSHRLPTRADRHSLKPFLFLALLFAIGFAGIVYSTYPFIVPQKLTVWDAAAPPARLRVVAAIAVAFALAIAVCTALAYRHYRGKVDG